MLEPADYPITIHLHPDTGIEPFGVEKYHDVIPNSIIGYRGSTPYQFSRGDIILIVGPDVPDDVMETVDRTIKIQMFEYILSMDRRALEFSKYLESKNSPPPATKHDHIGYR